MPDDPKDKDESKSKAKSKDGEGASGGIDVAAVVKAIKDGSITIADFAAIKSAMGEAEGAGTEPEAPETPEVTGAAASTPGAAMKREGVDPVEFAKVAADARSARAELETLKADRAVDAEVGAACERLKDRALGAGLRDNLIKFHRDHGSKAFSAYVEGLEKSAPRIAGTDERKAADFGANRGALPAVAMKYEKDGVDAVEKAAQFSREWEALSSAGHTRMTCERYVEINMAGGPKTLVK